MRIRIRRISVKLLAFNILLLSLPMGSILYLDTYEGQLLKAQEDSMIQQGRLLGAALTGSSSLEEDADRIIANLKNRVDSRLRVVDRSGVLLSDSSVSQNAAEKDGEVQPLRTSSADTFLYRTAVYPLNVIRRLVFPPSPDFGSSEYYSGRRILDGVEVRAALGGSYGAATRLSIGGQRSVNLYSAIPIFADDEETKVIGAVLVSRSTYQILSYLYDLRLDIIKIFLLFLVISVILSIALAMSITIPVVRLKNEAGEVLDDFGNFRKHFTGFKRHDEIGELSRSLTELSADLESKIEFINQFTSDILHELKNPLSAVKTAAEMAASSGEGGDHIKQILEEEKRMERLLAELRKLSILENRFENDKTEALDLSKVLPIILSRYDNIDFVDTTDEKNCIKINTDRFVQAVVNPVDNALSFSPDGCSVKVMLSVSDGFSRITIEDQGPGIADGSSEKVFERFYSDRNPDGRSQHSGLGLSIVKTIAAYYGGRCRIENITSDEGAVSGCRFNLELPLYTG